ncbi:MAG TPA: FISUMP domain-containing protein [Bacteroidales bacterium]|nr:FISUMP domain-containing protein [Bacteroidales bacterium]HQK68620.1 FISUMP domain-containing protein [Bacteroidales bacterium]
MKIKFYSLFAILIISVGYAQAQDYLIEFDGSGASTTVATVKVENLTQGTSLTMNGDNTLHLMKTLTGIETANGNVPGRVIFYPNPMDDYTRMKFVIPESGETVITLYDISGRKIVQRKEFLITGEHTFNIQGVREGIYFARINSGKYSLSGRLISTGSHNRETKIEYYNSDTKENTPFSQKEQGEIKGIYAETVMQYDAGDRLKLTGISDIYSTVIVDVPTESKTITFEFIPCTDGENNNYSVVKIGSQIWMGENLNTVRFNDLIPIPYISNATDWSNLSTPGISYYNNDPTTSSGAYYNWFAVNTGKLCPLGWHVPSTDEWSILDTYLGGDIVVGPKLMETGVDHWPNPNTVATNESGFTGLPGGYRNGADGSFYGFGTQASWITSTSYSSSQAYNRNLYDSGGYGSSQYSKNTGYSVRCIKDAEPELPTIFINEVKNVTSSTAKIECDVTNDGGETVTERGICWGENENPTVADSKIPSGTGTGIFNCTITYLDWSTTYYVRAYAKNNVGISYSEPQTFKTLPLSVTDADGNTYNSIRIGSQIWMDQNLKTTKYNDGTSIPEVTGNTNWDALTTPAFCWYGNDESTYQTVLYNWYTVNTVKVCPEGWHVPSDADWKNLELFLGVSSTEVDKLDWRGTIEGGKLKETGTVHWQSPNTGATNSFGFNGKPEGLRLIGGIFADIGVYAAFWSSTQVDDSHAYERRLHYTESRILRMNYWKKVGNSIRCMKDQ